MATNHSHSILLGLPSHFCDSFLSILLSPRISLNFTLLVSAPLLGVKAAASPVIITSAAAAHSARPINWLCFERERERARTGDKDRR